MNSKTPMCPECGAKFPGDPCKSCGKTAEFAKISHERRMARNTRKRKKHGRQT